MPIDTLPLMSYYADTDILLIFSPSLPLMLLRHFAAIDTFRYHMLPLESAITYAFSPVYAVSASLLMILRARYSGSVLSLLSSFSFQHVSLSLMSLPCRLLIFSLPIIFAAAL